MDRIDRVVRLLSMPALGVFLFWGAGGAAHAATPRIERIQTILPMGQVRVMTSPYLVAEVDRGGDSRSVVHRWEILAGGASGAETLETPQSSATRLHLWWGSYQSNPDALIGRTVRVRLTVRFLESPEDEFDAREVELVIEGVKRPPVPVISGDLGSNTERIPCGDGCRLGFNAYASTDPDGEAVGHRWGIDAVSPPSVPVTKVGGQGNQFGIIVPPIRTEMNIVLRLRGYSHLHEVDVTAVARLSAAGGATENRAPTMSAQTLSATVAQGQNLVLSANASDADGDNLAFTWTALDSSTVNSQYVTSVRTSASGAAPSTWTTTLNYPTTGLAAGQYTFSAQASETSTTQQLTSPRIFFTVMVTSAVPGGDGGTPPPPENQAPVPRIRYDLEGDGVFLGPHESGQTISTQSRAIVLDASASTDDGGYENLTFRWGKGFLEPGSFQNLSSPRTNLTLPATAQGKVTVSLTATDTQGKSATVTLVFQLLAVNEPPSAKIRFAEGEEGTLRGPFSSGYVVETGARTVLLDAGASTDDGGVENLQFSWEAGGLAGVGLSASQGIQSTLTVPPGVEGDVTVGLTATDEGGLTSTSSLVFRFSIAIPALSASIVSAPPSVQSGEEFSVEGVGQSSEGNGGLRYIWTAVCSEGQAVQVYSSGPRAKVVAPRLNGGLEEDWVTVSLVVRENGFESEPALIEIPITRPTLYFAQAAVGRIDAARRFETAIVLVNPTDEIAEGSILFINNFHGDGWTVQVDGVPRSDMPFELLPGEAKEFVLTGMDVEIGWLKIRSNVGVVGHLFYRVVEAGSGYVLSEAPILPVVGRGFRTALGRGSNEGVAIAMVNLGREEAHFRVRAAESEGRAFDTFDLVIGPGEHMARFLAEILDGVHNSNASIPADFSGGTLSIELVGGEGPFVTTILRTRDGLPLSILPVATPQ